MGPSVRCPDDDVVRGARRGLRGPRMTLPLDTARWPRATQYEVVGQARSSSSPTFSGSFSLTQRAPPSVVRKK